MNSRVIKFVAGGGKTTYAEQYMKKNKNGLYIAFNNSVVEELKDKGLLSKTIDSLFISFIIPKFISVIPLIYSGAVIKYIDNKQIRLDLKGVANIKIQVDGKIYNKGKYTGINLNITNKELHAMPFFKNNKFIKFIFSKDTLNINDQQRSELALYIIKKYPNEVIKILEKRFTYIIIDEAQDLKGYREEFAKLIYNSNLQLILLGDDNQNINGGGKWFSNLIANDIKNKTFRCSETICKWIRENINIEIFGEVKDGKYEKINHKNVLNYNDGKRVLLYYSNIGKNREIIKEWKGKKSTIKKAKGSTIEEDIVIIGKSMDVKNLYTAITRTKKNVYSTIEKIN